MLLSLHRENNIIFCYFAVPVGHFFQSKHLTGFLNLLSWTRQSLVIQISSIVTLWTDLEPAVSERFHLELAPSVQRLIECGTLPKECSEVTVPCVQPLLDLLSSSPSSTFLNTSSLSAQIGSFYKAHYIRLNKKSVKFSLREIFFLVHFMDTKPTEI